MEFVNAAAEEKKALGIEDAKDFVKILAPFAPFMAEELWCCLCHSGLDPGSIPKDYQSIHKQPWPMYDKSLLIDSSIQFVVQVNGKIRETLTITPEQGKDQKIVEDVVKKSEKLQKYLTTRPQKIIFISGKLINFVV